MIRYYVDRLPVSGNVESAIDSICQYNTNLQEATSQVTGHAWGLFDRKYSTIEPVVLGFDVKLLDRVCAMLNLGDCHD